VSVAVRRAARFTRNHSRGGVESRHADQRSKLPNAEAMPEALSCGAALMTSGSSGSTGLTRARQRRINGEIAGVTPGPREALSPSVRLRAANCTYAISIEAVQVHKSSNNISPLRSAA
jgi:hypothetical protein